MPWVKGQSGNPKGHIPKERALTRILEQAGSRAVEVDGKPISGKRLVARLVWEALTTGQVTFPNGGQMVISPDDWIAVAKWVYAQIDGPPKQEIGVSGPNGGPIQTQDLSALTVSDLLVLIDAAQPTLPGKQTDDEDPPSDPGSPPE